MNEGQWGSPGSFFLGRNVPWSFAYEVTEPEFVRAMASPSVNRVVTYEGRALAELQDAGFTVLETDGAATLLAR